MILERLLRSLRPLTQGADGAVSFLLAAGVAGVLVWRAVHLAGGESPLSARAERDFFLWSYRDRSLHAQLAEAATRLRRNDAICIEVEPAAADPAWIQAMAHYYFPEQAVLGVRSLPDTRGCPGTRVVLRRGALAAVILQGTPDP